MAKSDDDDDVKKTEVVLLSNEKFGLAKSYVGHEWIVWMIRMIMIIIIIIVIMVITIIVSKKLEFCFSLVVNFTSFPVKQRLKFEVLVSIWQSIKEDAEYFVN